MTARYRLSIAPRHGIALQLLCDDCPASRVLASWSQSDIALDDLHQLATSHDTRVHLKDDVDRQLAGARAAIDAANRHLTPRPARPPTEPPQPT